MWIYFILGGWGWGGHSTNHRGLLLLLVLSVKALSLLISLTCPEAGILAGIFSVISFCTHMPSWKGGQQGRAGGQEVAPFPIPTIHSLHHVLSWALALTQDRFWRARRQAATGPGGRSRDGQRGGRLRPGWKEQREGPATASQERKRHPVNKRLPREAGALGGRKKAGHLDGLARNGRKVGEGRSESGENCPGQGNRKGGEAGSWEEKGTCPSRSPPRRPCLGLSRGESPAIKQPCERI